MLYHNRKQLILASGSPRRREMLEVLGIEFQVVASGVDESVSGGDGGPGALACRCALAKAERVASLFPTVWVLAADTVVSLDDRVFGKPMDDAGAITMLESLSGRTHRVFSGMALIHQDERVCREGFVCTSVTFRSLGADEIRAYARTGEPFDKAGGYGIQGLGAFLVRSIVGSYTNVVGLPLGETLDLLLDHEIIKPR